MLERDRRSALQFQYHAWSNFHSNSYYIRQKKNLDSIIQWVVSEFLAEKISSSIRLLSWLGYIYKKSLPKKMKGKNTNDNLVREAMPSHLHLLFFVLVYKNFFLRENRYPCMRTVPGWFDCWNKKLLYPIHILLGSGQYQVGLSLDIGIIRIIPYAMLVQWVHSIFCPSKFRLKTQTQHQFFTCMVAKDITLEDNLSALTFGTVITYNTSGTCGLL